MLTALRLLISNLWVPNSWHYHEMIRHVQLQMLSCWNLRSKQDDVAINHHFENNPKPAGRPLQSCGAATVRWETQHFGLEAAGDTETPRRLECEARADPNGAVQSMQTPVLGPKFCQQLFNQFALDLQHSGIEHAIEKAGVYHCISMKFIPSVEQLLAAFSCFKVQFLTLALLHKGESAWSLDVAGHEDLTCKNHQRPYYGI